MKIHYIHVHAQACYIFNAINLYIYAIPECEQVVNLVLAVIDNKLLFTIQVYDLRNMDWFAVHI